MQALLEKVRLFIDKERFEHTMGVVETAIQLAHIFPINVEKAKTAALLHDCARCYPDEKLLEMAEELNLSIDTLERMQPVFLHGKIGAEIAKREFAIKDEEVLNAIRRHTLGDEKMNLLDKVIFIADMIEPGRDYPMVGELRRLAKNDIDEALLAGFNSTITYVINRNCIIHPKSIQARNAVLAALKNKKAGTT